MLLQVDFKIELFRWLFQPLYKRVFNEAVKIGTAEDVIYQRFLTLVNKAPDSYFLIDLENNDIQGHCICNIQYKRIIIEQVEGKEEFIKEVFTWIENNTEAEIIMLWVPENEYSSFKQKYEFTVASVPLQREIKRADSVQVEN